MRRRARKIGHLVRYAALAFIVAFMFAPTAIMAVLSFSGEPHVSFPPEEWGLRQYHQALFGGRWMPALGRSLVVAGASSAVALAVGVLALFAMNRAGLRGQKLLQALAMGPLLVPSLALAIALYIVFARIHLLGTGAGLILAHSVLALPFVVIVVNAAAARVPLDLERAAMGLGAGRARALLDVTGRILLPAFVAAAVLAFLTSFDEVVVTSFVAGIGYETLPRAIFDDVRSGVDPAIAAIGMLLTAVTGLLLGGAALVRRKAA